MRALQNIFLVGMIFFASALHAQTNLCTRPSALSKSHIKISIFYGYIDQRPDSNTLDPIRAQEMLTNLTQPCFDSQALCGFVLVDGYEQNRWVLQKYTELQTIEILLINSAISEDDSSNQGQQLQMDISSRNEFLFLQELQNSDFVLYQGHSRYGFGPDFNPPIINSIGNIRKNYYLNSQQKNISKLLSNLRNRPDKIGAIGIFSCDSQKHFSNQIQLTKKSELTLLTSKISYSSQLQKPMIQFLENILNQDCLQKNVIM